MKRDPHFDMTIAHSVDEIGQPAWDALSAGRPFTSYRWYRFGETVLADCLPIYAIASLNGEPLARATFWKITDEPIPLPTLARKFVEPLFRRWPLLICRSPLSNASGLILPEGALRASALQAIAQAAQKIADEQRISFLLFDFLYEVECSGWPGAFRAIDVSDPGTQMIVRWKTFDEYLAATNKHGRQHYKRTVREAAERGMVLTRHAQAEQIEAAENLIHNVERRKASAPNPWTRRLIQNLELVNGTWLTATIGGRLVGCGLALEDNGAHLTTALGLDYQIQYAYFMLMYADIQLAIEHGAHLIRWGSGAHDVKARLGFVLEENNHALVTSRHTILRKLIRWVPL